MINLLPPFEKEKILREYRFRFFTTLLATFFVLSLISIVSFFPTYVLTISKYKGYVEDSEKSLHMVVIAKQQEIEGEIREINRKTDLLSAPNGSPHARQLFDMVLQSKAEGIVLSSLLYEGPIPTKQLTENESGTEATERDYGSVSIHGKASTRNELEVFRDSLKTIPEFEKADFPISSLVRERDIAFVITIPLVKTKITL